jgi:hypothetical protein
MPISTVLGFALYLAVVPAAATAQSLYDTGRDTWLRQAWPVAHDALYVATIKL